MNNLDTMPAEAKANLLAIFNTIRPGDKVTIETPQGQLHTGKAVICGQKSNGVVALNMGGRHGTPGSCTLRNFVDVRHTKLYHGGG